MCFLLNSGTGAGVFDEDKAYSDRIGELLVADFTESRFSANSTLLRDQRKKGSSKRTLFLAIKLN
jgi:hypothetical protein